MHVCEKTLGTATTATTTTIIVIILIITIIIIINIIVMIITLTTTITIRMFCLSVPSRKGPLPWPYLAEIPCGRTDERWVYVYMCVRVYVWKLTCAHGS
jgi:hypothetical protein